ncbi:MAG TPA: ATP-binding protein [Thermoanaerobaculia bacterium]|nr:ATP-binding protein [Thermoanaerobaculia bacterium]
MRRVVLATVVLLLGMGGLCGAWWVTAQRALDAELRLQNQLNERASADRLTQQLEELRRSESERPWFHYQNLYHDPKGASQGLSVVPSPLASGTGNPLVAANFQVDARGRVSLPTLNEELTEFNAKNAREQRAIRDALAASAKSIREAAAPLVVRVEEDASEEQATARRIALLEARIAAKPPVAPARKYAKIEEPKVQEIDRSAFLQNVSSNAVFQQLKQAPANEPPSVTPAPAPAQREATPVKIWTSDLEWRTVSLGDRRALVALRAVQTPTGTLVQGLLTQLEEGAIVDGAIVTPKNDGTSIAGTGWHATLATPLQTAERQRFARNFIAVCGVLLLVVIGVIWTLSRVEKLARDRARFAATAAHELRTPLASLRLYSDLIAEEEEESKRVTYARELASQTERLGRVVANVLEVTRLERGTFSLKPRVGAIGHAVQECIERLRPQLDAAHCPVALRVADELPEIAFDPDALQHVVDNLVDNAEKFSRDVPDRSIDVEVARADDGVAITVSDRGPGVPETLFRAPRPFRRGHDANAPAGLGLGLYLVDRIVRGHGGVLRTEARPGGGARVRVFLPSFYRT